MSTLNVLSQELIKVEAHLAESHGELDAQLEYELEQINKDLVQKVDSYTYRIEKLTLVSAFWAKKANDAKEISKRIDSHIDRLKETIQINMDLMGKKELNGETTRFYIRKSSKPTVVIEDSSIVPREFVIQKITVSADKEAIAEVLKRGENVAGAKLEVREYLAMGIVKKD